MAKRIRSSVVLLFTIVTGACATVAGPVAVVRAVDPAAPRMIIGINDAFHAPLPPELLAHYCA